MKPKISIIMAEYNTDTNLLIESIKSIITQTYKNWELIIIDDCGKNNVKRIIEKFKDKRIKVYKNDSNRGLVFSLNRAITLCDGEFIARMDTDDYAYKNRLAKQIECLLQNTDFDMVCCNMDYYDGKEIWGCTKGEGLITRNQLINNCPIYHPTVMVKKERIIECGGYSNYNRCEDFALWIEMYSRGFKIYKMNDRLLRYHLSESDYKKRTLKSRNGYFKLIKTQYKKLNPTRFQVFKIYIKTFISGIIPGKIMYHFHRKKNQI